MSSVGQYCNTTSPRSQRSFTKWRFVSMCLDRLLHRSDCAKLRHPWLSSFTTVASLCFSLRSPSSRRNQIISWHVSVRATYSASSVDSVTQSCLRQAQESAPPKYNTTSPVVDFLVPVSPAQSLSENTTSPLFPPPRFSFQLHVPLRQRITLRSSSISLRRSTELAAENRSTGYDDCQGGRIRRYTSMHPPRF